MARDRQKYQQICLIFFSSSRKAPQQKIPDSAESYEDSSNISTEASSYYKPQMFSLVCWTKNTPKLVLWLYQTKHFILQINSGLSIWGLVHMIIFCQWLLLLHKGKWGDLWALQQGKAALKLLRGWSQATEPEKKKTSFGREPTREAGESPSWFWGDGEGNHGPHTSALKEKTCGVSVPGWLCRR